MTHVALPEIKLHKLANGWVAQYVDDCVTVARVGTDTIPTVFTEIATPVEVLREVQRSNPDYLVTLPVR